MQRNGTKGMCCGAGGARMWMEESIGTRSTTSGPWRPSPPGATRVATACPFCYIMLDDGVKAAGVEEDQVKVADIAIHLLDAHRDGRAPARRPRRPAVPARSPHRRPVTAVAGTRRASVARPCGLPNVIEPGAGQESVWDYPRPPAVSPTDEHVRVVHRGVVVADTRRSIRILETSQPPAYYLPPDDVDLDRLRRQHDAHVLRVEGRGHVLVDRRRWER